MKRTDFLEVIARWDSWWQRLHDMGEPGFEDAGRPQDWLGSVDAYTRLHALTGALHFPPADEPRRRH